MQILGSVAGLERSIVERTGAGRRQYDADYKSGRIGKDKHSKSGKNLPSHRPKKIFCRDLAREMRAAGKSLRAIATELEVPLTTIVGALKSE